MAERQYYVHILTNRPGGLLYTGITNDVVRRVCEHRAGLHRGFSRRYNLIRLVYLETTYSVNDAIAREKAIKGWTRRRKVELIESINPEWRDLSGEW